MSEISPADLVTVYTSSDRNAELDASAVRTVLVQNGLNAVLYDDTAADVAPGAWEVRVPFEELRQAESLVAAASGAEDATPDPSEDLDFVTIAELQGTTGEIEAIGMRTILDANGILSVLVGSSTLPSLSFQVKVPANEVPRAEAALAEARAAGPAAAAEAERATEGQLPPPG